MFGAHDRNLVCGKDLRRVMGEKGLFSHTGHSGQLSRGAVESWWQGGKGGKLSVTVPTLAADSGAVAGACALGDVGILS
jgi:hypothetical protein